jgi:acetyl esterase/lipase
MFRPLALAAAVTLFAPFASAAEPTTLNVWPDKAPGDTRKVGPEEYQPEQPGQRKVARLTNVSQPTLAIYQPPEDKRTGAAVVICPGGGYSGLSMEKEGREVDEWLRSKGIVGVVLRYRCGGGKNQQPVPLEDAQRAIRTVRAKAAELGVDPQKVGILGFSAGGHLASTAATMFDEGKADAEDAVERQSSRPDFAVLVYPVITLVGEAAHQGSRNNLLGAGATEALAETWSTDRRVTDKTPPTFLVHAGDDKGVPVENSLRFYKALLANRVPAEMHVYEVGGHGFGMFREDRPAAKWPEQLERWLKARAIVP